MHVARMVAVAVQTYRPAAVEPCRPPIAPPQGVFPHADEITVARDRLSKGAKQRLNDRILTARKVLSGLGTLTQRLVEKPMPVWVVQCAQVRRELGQEAGEIGPPRRRFDERRQNHLVVVAERLVAGVVPQP